MNNEEITQETNEEVIDTPQADLTALQAKYDDLLNSIPKALTEDEKAFKQRESDLFTKEVALTLRENNLAEYAPILKVTNEEELTAAIELLNSINKKSKLDNSYVPTSNNSDEYNEATQKKDVKNMIAAKFKFFNK